MDQRVKWKVIPNVAKAGGRKSQGAEGEAVVVYCEPLATRVADPAVRRESVVVRLSRRVKKMANYRPNSGMHGGLIPATLPAFALDSMTRMN